MTEDLDKTQELKKPRQEQDHMAGGFLGDIKKVQEIMGLIEQLQKVDANQNNSPDFMDLLAIGQQAFADLNEFKEAVPKLTLATMVEETQKFLAKMRSHHDGAMKIVGDDLKVFKERFPELLKDIPLA